MQTLKDKYLEKFPSQTRALLNAAKNRMLAHAYLLYSDSLEVRKEFSALIAQAGACPNPLDDSSPCGVCTVCSQLATGTYAGLFTLSPVSKSRQIVIGEDSNEPDTMRWFNSLFYLSNIFQGLRKVGIIYDADCLNTMAQNAFLKTLEEPPKDSLLVLNTQKPFSLLPTIRSRCHIITMLTNSCSYNFKNTQNVILSLMRLLCSRQPDISVGEECASALIETSRQLKEEAQANILPLWQKRLDDAENPDLKTPTGIRKRITEAYEAAVSSEYLRLRSCFISLIHTWFGQAFELASGASIESLPNPEIYGHLDIKHSIPDQQTALKFLNKSEKLLQNLSWNVNEELVFREFCLTLHL
ncbi:MAG: hypothetical protein JW808_09475 [Victivallales bacterium]|nr:hypothetical protein [Victivallales bacterium]